MNQPPMRQYANARESGTVASTSFQRDPNDAIIDRVMMIAQRLVAAENVIKQQQETIEKLEKKVDNIALKASGTEWKKPETKTRKPRTTKPKTTTEPTE